MKLGPGERFGFTLRLRPMVSKNGRIIVARGRGRPTLTKSRELKQWMRLAEASLAVQWGGRDPLEQQWLNVSIRSYCAKRQTPDASNLYEAPQDALQAAGVLANDYWVRTHDRSERIPWKEHQGEARVEIEIREWFPAGIW